MVTTQHFTNQLKFFCVFPDDKQPSVADTGDPAKREAEAGQTDDDADDPDFIYNGRYKESLLWSHDRWLINKSISNYND